MRKKVERSVEQKLAVGCVRNEHEKTNYALTLIARFAVRQVFARVSREEQAACLQTANKKRGALEKRGAEGGEGEGGAEEGLP